MKFSVAMATFNGARFLRDQLTSISAQSVLPSELVVCDDGSTDATLEVVRDFARSAPFEVRVEQNERRLGVSDNFLRAASLCKHEWIAFCDQDDVWLPGKLEAVAELVAGRPLLMLVVHRASVVDEELRPTGKLLHVPDVRRLSIIPRLARGFWDNPYGFTMTFSARALRAAAIEGRPIDGHDRWIAVMAGILGDTAYLPRPLALYRRHGQNLSQLHTPQGPASDVRGAAERGELDHAAQLVDRLWRYLEQSVEAAGASDVEQLREASRVYRRMAEALAVRAELCRKGASVPARARRFVENLRRGGYAQHRSGGLGWRAAVKDAVRVVVL